MARRSSPHPTEVELEILRVLWARGPSSVREVHLELQGSSDRGYSTTLKMMQVMYEKGMLLRDVSARPQRYRPALAEAQTQRRFLDYLVQKVFGGSTRKLVLQAVESGNVNAEELAEIRRLIKKMEGGKS